MQTCGAESLSFLSGAQFGSATLGQSASVALGQLLKADMKARAITAQACRRPSPSHEILLFPAIPEELSRGPGRQWAGYTAAR